MTLQDILDRNIRLPVCPTVYLRLLELLNTEEVQSSELTKLISADPALMVQIIRVANSPYYGASRQIRSLEDALMRIGFSQIWSIASALKAKDAFDASSSGWTGANAVLWDHALRTATAARSLARSLNPRFAEFFFTAGMLHDIGKVVLLRAEPRYPAVCSEGQLWGTALIFKERLAYRTDHASLGADLLQHWNFPNTLSTLVRDYHDDIPAGRENVKAVNLLACADEIAHYWDPQPGKDSTRIEHELSKSVLEGAGVKADVLARVACEYHADYKKLRSV